MAIHEFNLKVVSPMFLNGADTKQPELRAASVRGQLRYWLRAYLGAQTSDLKKIWDEESAVFGSTGQGSTVSVRVFGIPSVGRHPMLPHREGTQENVSMGLAIEPDQTFTLQLVTRPGVDVPQAIIALKLWSLLGGLGKRSRRMMGSIQVYPQQNTLVDWYPNLSSPDDLKNAILSVLPQKTVTQTDLPDFPILHPNHSWIIIGHNYDDVKEANQELFRKLLRNTKFKPQADAFGYAKRDGRRASPVIAQIRKLGDTYYPVITAFRSNPLRRNYSDILRDFMQDATRYYNGIHVWGGW